MDKYARGWRDSQPKERDEVNADWQREMARLDDEIQRGGNPVATLVFLLFSVLVATFLVFGVMKMAHTVRESQQRSEIQDTVPGMSRHA